METRPCLRTCTSLKNTPFRWYWWWWNWRR